MIDDQTKLVFISYSWEKSEDVKVIVDRLIRDGVDVIFDRYDLKHGNNLASYMEQAVSNPDIDYVLVFCDKTYAEKANARKGGVGIESIILSQEVYDNIGQDRIIPVVIERDGDTIYLPTFLKGLFHIDLTRDNFEKGYEDLLRHIYNKPLDRKPKLGKQPAWLEDESVDYSEIRRIVEKDSFSEITDLALFSELSGCLKELIQSDLPDIESCMGVIDREKICRDLIVDYYIKRIEKNEKVGNSMGNLLEYIEDNVVFTRDNRRQDLVDFFKWEYVIVFVAILVKCKKYHDLSDLVKKTFFIKSRYMSPETISYYNHSCSTIDEDLNRLKGMNKLSMQSHILVGRTYIPYFDSDDLPSADVLLYHLSCLLGFKRKWFPKSYVYLEQNMEIWSRLQSRSHCENLFELLDVDDVESMKLQIGKCENPFWGYQRSFGSAPWITDYTDIEKIGTLR